MPTLDCLTVATGDAPVGSVIWLHGLGADATDFEPIVPLLPLNVPLRFVFPNAPERPVTINGGMVMRAPIAVAICRFGVSAMKPRRSKRSGFTAPN